MKLFAINTRSSSPFAFSAALILALALFAPTNGKTQQLQQGVSVQMAVTSNAAPMPAADNQDAWIVAVAADGSFYFGINPITREGLADAMIRTPRNHDQKLYIKADARAPYTDVEYVLKAAHTAEFNAPVLLTTQPESPAPGSIVAPKGLEVLLDATGGSPAGAEPVVVRIRSGQRSPVLKIDGKDASWAAFQNTLRRLLQNHSEKVVRMTADGQLPFADVVYVIDASRSAGAKVVLPLPSL